MMKWKNIGLIAGIVLFLAIISWKFFFQTISPIEIFKSKGFVIDYSPSEIVFPPEIDQSKLGKINLINFWATWCQPCVKELPDFDEIAGEYREEGLRVFTIARGESEERVTEFLLEKNIPSTNVTYLSDEKMELFSELDLNLIPITLMTDSNGKIIAGVTGIRDWHNPELRSAISQLLTRP